MYNEGSSPFGHPTYWGIFEENDPKRRLIAIANRKLRVWEDPRIDAVTGMLPGANCGACGYAGCRAFAEATIKGEVPPAKCTVMDAFARARGGCLLVKDVGELSRTAQRKLTRVLVEQATEHRLAARLVGMSRAAAVEFSFLLGAMTLGAATVYEATGNGPVNALFGAVDDDLQPVLGWHPALSEYEIKAVSSGEDAQGQVLVRCRRSSDEGPGARVVTGHGLSTNIIEASLEDSSHDGPATARAFEEFAVEASILKVAASEMLDYVLDDARSLGARLGEADKRKLDAAQLPLEIANAK